MRYFFTALMFYTRIPCPSWVDHDAEALNKATVFFPFIGWIVGLISGITFYFCTLFLPLSVSVLIAMILGILTTGAFHEDGFADVCDGFGGGWTKLKILEIMKDSRIGAYGVIGMVLLLGLKYATLAEIFEVNSSLAIILLTIAAHALSRFCAVVIIYFYHYVRENEDSKAKPVAKKLSIGRFLAAAGFGLVPVFIIPFFTEIPIFLSLIPIAACAICMWLMARYFKKWIGGYTGDCLGATQQVTEVVFYLTILCICRFI